jgi:hypothetical protein
VALIGTFTDIGIDKARDAAENLGFKIVATSFAVSNQKTMGGIPVLKTLTGSNAGTFYTGLVSSAVLVGAETVQVSAVIPPGQAAGQEEVNDIYLFAKDINNVDFLLAVGQPQLTNPVLYDPTGETTLRLQLRLTNADLTSFLQFQYTQASELSEHNQDPNAHPDIRDLLDKAGLFAQPSEHEFIGQSFDEFPDFDNAVSDDDLVYLDDDGVYKRAVADGTDAAKVAGIAKLEQELVVVDGIVEKNHGYAPLTRLYLHPTNPGQVTDVPSGIPVGLALTTLSIALRVDEPQDIASQVDAVVSFSPGYRHFTDAQAAIDSVADGGWVRFDVDYPLHGPDPLDTDGKTVNFLFTGVKSGVSKFEGLNEIQLIEFDNVPDAGDYRLSHEGNRTTRLAYNANAAAVEAALEALPSIDSVTVTGDYSNGFTIEFTAADGLQDQSAVTIGTSPGINEIQKITFSSSDFDSGTFRLQFAAENTAAIAFNNISAASIESALEALTTLDSVTVTELSPSEFQVEFTGADGIQDQPLIVAPPGDNSLEDSASDPITITITEETAGELPDNLLEFSGGPVAVTTDIVQEGEEPGSDTAFLVEAEGCQFVGLGRISGMQTGIDLNSQVNTRIEMFFDGIPTPVDDTSVARADYSTHGSLGLSATFEDEVAFRDLAKVKAQGTPDFTTIVTSAVATLPDGSQQGLSVGRRVTDFSGAVIDWSTGDVTGGDDFTPYTPTDPEAYFKYAVILRTTDGTLGVILPSGESSVSAAAAPSPHVRGGSLRAVVTVKGDGMGGIEVIEPSSIRNFVDTGAIQLDVAEVRIPVGAPATVFDVSPYTDFRFDSDNSVLDIRVRVNGQWQIQDQAGGTTLDYRKISDKEIEFNASIEGGYVDVFITAADTSGNSSPVAATAFPEVQDEGVALATQAGTLNFVGEAVEATQDSPGVHKITVSPSEGANVGTGPGNLFKQRVGLELQFRRLLGGPGLVVTQDGDDVVISLADTSYFKQFRTNLSGTLITSAALYDLGVAKLAVYRNGLRMIDSLSVGQAADQYQEDSSRVKVLLTEAAVTSDVFGYVHMDTQPSWYALYDGVALDGETNLTTPFPYVLGNDRVRVYRNGLLMNTSGHGPTTARYAEFDVNTIVLDEPLSSSDWVYIEYDGLSPLFREDVSGFVGNTLALANQYTVGTGKLLVYRNGALMNDVAYGSTTDQYSETGTEGNPSDEVSLGANAALNDYFTVVALA